MKNNKDAKGNALIIASVIFVTVAAVVFVIALSLFNSGNNENNNSSSGGVLSVPESSLSVPQSSSSSKPESSSSIPQSSSSSKPESSSSVPQSSSSSKPESSSSVPQSSSSSKPESSSSAPQSSSSSKPESSSSVPQSSSSSKPGNPSGGIEISEAQAIVENARLLLGTPFKQGGTDPSGFDSSGFIYYVMRESGFITCPRNIGEQAKMGVFREYSDLKPGDLVFFSNDDSGTPHFGGVYIGDGKMIGCLVTSTFEGVVEANINNNYYRTHFAAGVGIS